MTTHTIQAIDLRPGDRLRRTGYNSTRRYATWVTVASIVTGQRNMTVTDTAGDVWTIARADAVTVRAWLDTVTDEAK